MPIPLLIIVPTLNSHRLLPRLVISLQGQSWSHWRLIFIDGPSGAEHREWLEHFCAAEPRCRWLEQSPAEPGIFGAMNQGFAEAAPNDWIVFLGSDDWLAGPNVLADAFDSIEASSPLPDLLVCRGRYFDAAQGALTRFTVFSSTGLLTTTAYRRALLLGSTPPHQATFIGPGAWHLLSRYASGFHLSADLDFFLQLSRQPGLRLQCLDLELVHMADDGVSGQQVQRRLQEVRRAYRRAFGWYWWFPFLMRYLRRAASLLACSR